MFKVNNKDTTTRPEDQDQKITKMYVWCRMCSVSSVTYIVKSNCLPKYKIDVFGSVDDICFLAIYSLALYWTTQKHSIHNLKEWYLTLKRQPYKMVKHIQTIHRMLSTNCLSVFDLFVGLALKGLIPVITLTDLQNLFRKISFPDSKQKITQVSTSN